MTDLNPVDAMTIDYRAMCAELLMALEGEGYANWCTPPDENELCLRARALLAQPVEEGPSDEELLRMAATEIGYEFTSSWFLTGSNSLQFEVAPLELLNLLRAVLSRHGHPTPQPVAVSERLPGPEDVNEDGNCWMWDRESCFWDWTYIRTRTRAEMYTYTHWLPANALPTPEVTNE